MVFYIRYCFYLFNESSWLRHSTDQEIEGSNPSGCTIKNKELRVSLEIVTPCFLGVLTNILPNTIRQLPHAGWTRHKQW